MIYDYKPDRFDYNYINEQLSKKSIIEVLDSILRWADCTRIYNDGSRPLTTFHHGYKKSDWEYQYVLDYAKEKGIDVGDYKNKFIELHNKNIEFEKLNPPKLPVSKNSKTNKNEQKVSRNASNIRKARRKDMFTGEVVIELVDEHGNIIKENKIKPVHAAGLVFNFKSK